MVEPGIRVHVNDIDPLGKKQLFFFTVGLLIIDYLNTGLDALRKIHVPTLIMHGIHDQVVPYHLGIVQN